MRESSRTPYTLGERQEKAEDPTGVPQQTATCESCSLPIHKTADDSFRDWRHTAIGSTFCAKVRGKKVTTASPALPQQTDEQRVKERYPQACIGTTEQIAWAEHAQAVALPAEGVALPEIVYTQEDWDYADAAAAQAKEQRSVSKPSPATVVERMAIELRGAWASISARERQLGEYVSETAALRKQLQEMTADRNLWQDAHGDDCPYKASAEALRKQLEEARDCLSILYDKYEFGDQCTENGDEDGSYMGNCVHLSGEEEDRIIAALEGTERSGLPLHDGKLSWRECAEAAEAQLKEEEKAHMQTITQRDSAEDALDRAFTLVTGTSPEWSNLFGYTEAINEIAAAVCTSQAEGDPMSNQAPIPCGFIGQYGDHRVSVGPSTFGQFQSHCSCRWASRVCGDAEAISLGKSHLATVALPAPIPEAAEVTDQQQLPKHMRIPEHARMPVFHAGVPAPVSPEPEKEPLQSVIEELQAKADKYSEQERVARNEGQDSVMDWASGMKHAFFIAIRALKSVAAPVSVGSEESKTDTVSGFPSEFELRHLVMHLWIHSGYPNGGRNNMTTREKEVWDGIGSWPENFWADRPSAPLPEGDKGEQLAEENAGLRKRIHQIERHNQWFERCESAWCNPSNTHFGKPALDNLKEAVERARKAEAELAALKLSHPSLQDGGDVVAASPVLCEDCAGEGVLGIDSKTHRLIACETCGGHEDAPGRGYISNPAHALSTRQPEQPEAFEEWIQPQRMEMLRFATDKQFSLQYLEDLMHSAWNAARSYTPISASGTMTPPSPDMVEEVTAGPAFEEWIETVSVPLVEAYRMKGVDWARLGWNAALASTSIDLNATRETGEKQA